MKPIVLREEAEIEFEIAALTIERARTGYGFLFRRAVTDALELISANPQIVARVPRTNCRQYVIAEYSHFLIYREMDQEIQVIAIQHTSRHPNAWKKRLRNP